MGVIYLDAKPDIGCMCHCVSCLASRTRVIGGIAGYIYILVCGSIALVKTLSYQLPPPTKSER